MLLCHGKREIDYQNWLQHKQTSFTVRKLHSCICIKEITKSEHKDDVIYNGNMMSPNDSLGETKRRTADRNK